MALIASAAAKPRVRVNNLPALLAVLAVTGLAGCGGGSSAPAGLTSDAPIALTPKADASPGGGGALAGKVNEPELRRAVELYGITKKRDPGQYDFAGVDLNGDGRPEAIVLFSGNDWCQKTGCSLVVFQQESVGYRVVSHMVNVRPGVMVGPESSFGWRDLMVKTGGGNAPLRTVRLGFSGKGYPQNALLQPEPVADMLSRSQEVMPESPAFAAANNQPPS
ncbi:MULTISPECIES: hypothetical protein [Rhodomicrobium]|uniref:hypothetical protein n=1 Tax=Rhodomicrobium TaxID=1068 RepID=UPI000B4A96A6|nr:MULTISPECIES: hypothetical protein [Rhodomicrobium]